MQTYDGYDIDDDSFDDELDNRIAKATVYDCRWNGDLAQWEAQGLPVKIYRTERAKLLWDKVVKLAKNDVEAKEIPKNSTRFVVNPVRAGDNTIETHNGAISVHDAGTGFMCIKRSVFERMIEEYPDLKFVDDTGSMNDEEKNWTYAFFNSFVDDDQRFVSEDYGFCRYWQKMGGKIWVDPAIEIDHLGRFMFQGRMMDYLMEIASNAPKNQE